DIVYTGLRHGEKLHEDLFGDGEADERPLHPLISHVAVPPLGAEAARAITLGTDRDAVVEQLVDLCVRRPGAAPAAQAGQRRPQRGRSGDLRVVSLATAP